MVTYEVTDIMNTQTQGVCKSVVPFCRMFKVNITEELDTGNQCLSILHIEHKNIVNIGLVSQLSLPVCYR